MKLGLNHPMGPLTLADFIGLDVVLAILDYLYEEFGDPKYKASSLLRKSLACNVFPLPSGPEKQIRKRGNCFLDKTLILK